MLLVIKKKYEQKWIETINLIKESRVNQYNNITPNGVIVSNIRYAMVELTREIANNGK